MLMHNIAKELVPSLVSSDSMLKCPRGQNVQVRQIAQSQNAQITFSPSMTKCPG